MWKHSSIFSTRFSLRKFWTEEKNIEAGNWHTRLSSSLSILQFIYCKNSQYWCHYSKNGSRFRTKSRLNVSLLQSCQQHSTTVSAAGGCWCRDTWALAVLERWCSNTWGVNRFLSSCTECTRCNLSVAKLVVSHGLLYLSSLQFILIVAIWIVYLAAVSPWVNIPPLSLPFRDTAWASLCSTWAR